MGQETKRLRASDLTRGEKLYIYRTRLGFSQQQMSVEYGVCLSEYRAMEHDDEGTKPPYLSVAPLQLFEEFATRRRRSGMKKVELAKVIGVSAYWLGRMESGTAPIGCLKRYWGSQNAVE